MVYVAILLMPPIIQIYFFCQIKVELLFANKVSIKIPSKYLDYTDIFSFNLVIELPKITGINEYAIKLVDNKQLF